MLPSAAMIGMMMLSAHARTARRCSVSRICTSTWVSSSSARCFAISKTIRRCASCYLRRCGGVATRMTPHLDSPPATRGRLRHRLRRPHAEVQAAQHLQPRPALESLRAARDLVNLANLANLALARYLVFACVRFALPKRPNTFGGRSPPPLLIPGGRARELQRFA